ncbi:MAG: hypothetical protein ACR2J3_08510 [Aridibacter sp.]
MNLLCKVFALAGLVITVTVGGCTKSVEQTSNTIVNDNASQNITIQISSDNENVIDEKNENANEAKPAKTENTEEAAAVNVKGDFSHMKPEYADVLKKWLVQNNSWEPAVKTDSDGRFPPNAHPYYVAGDFNKDGKEDFAVGLVKSKNRKKLAFAVFNAPFKDNKPAFFTDKTESSDILILKEDNELLIGTFESDDGYRLSPKGDKYEVQMLGDEMP